MRLDTRMTERERRMGREGSQGRVGWRGEALAWSAADMLRRETRGGVGYRGSWGWGRAGVRRMLGRCAARGCVHGRGGGVCGVCVVSVAAAGWAPPACVWRAVGHTHRRARGAARRHLSQART